MARTANTTRPAVVAKNGIVFVARRSDEVRVGDQVWFEHRGVWDVIVIEEAETIGDDSEFGGSIVQTNGDKHRHGMFVRWSTSIGNDTMVAETVVSPRAPR